MLLSQLFRIKTTAILLVTVFACNKPTVEPDPGTVHDDSANYTVTTFAGLGNNGNDPGTGGLALLNNPTKIAFDVQGNLYVADTDNDKIRKITPAGVMTTLAGSTIGYADATGAAAMFNRPSALCLDAQGNVYVAEAGNLRIRKITPAGVVTTLAGNGLAGLVDGTGVAAQINIPGGMCIDGQGNIFFTQINFHGIRKISPAGAVSAFVGSTTPGFADSTGAAAKFNEPLSITIDVQGNIYVSDFKNSRIRKVTPGGVVSTVVQRTNENEMHNIAIDGTGNFYISQGDFVNSEFVKVTPAGVITKIAGGVVGFVDGIGTVARFSYITGMTVSANGDIYVAELFNNTIRKIKRN
jgi:streptogramin lyase